MKALLAVLIAALGLSAASADLLRVTLAAPVFVSGVELPPGVCTVQEMTHGNDNMVLLIRASSGEQATVLANRISNNHESNPGVVLRLQNGRYSLDQVWLSAEDGFQILRSKAE
ncbi:exported hypothetical protein [Candidatus Sulfopaludibacter sp. SbA3]|nr:exported hypothetical protein [Candidatus Sulfopaludibacter sp. SbA3]